ncbi:MAG: ABC transporter ATP-binding protein [Parvibaculum sp.]
MIETQNLSVQLGEHAALWDASISINKGELVGFIGPNGAGKTSLLRAILRLVPVSGGRVLLNGEDITHAKPHAHARSIAYLPQGQSVAWPLMARNLVALGRMPHLNSWTRLGPEDKRAIDEALAAADATDLQGRPVSELSGGERARVLLARALAVKAAFLLVDEPTASLDPYHQLTSMEALKRACDSGTGVGLVVHDLSLANRFCDRLYLLNKGRVVASGTPEDVLSEKNMADVYRVEVRREANGTIRLGEKLPSQQSTQSGEQV